MRGLSATTGRVIEGDAYLAQCIDKILFTPLGSRVMRRDFGSLLMELLDQPLNAALRLRLYAATAIAIMRDPLPIRPVKVALVASAEEPGSAALDLEYQRTDLPQPSARQRLLIPVPALALAA